MSNAKHIVSKFPDCLGDFSDLKPSEVMYYLYFPIKVPGSSNFQLPPQNLRWLLPMIEAVIKDSSHDEWKDRYLYVTCKNFYVEPNSFGNRPGWHGDGFGTSDYNYVWCDSSPTEFCVQDFHTSDDDMESLKDFEEQARPENIKTVECGKLYKMDETHIHRVALNEKGGMRAFVKLSLSKHKFNLEGNSVNPHISGNWKFYSRQELRNMESKDSNGDFVHE